MVCGAQRQVSPTQWLLSMAYLPLAEHPSKRTGEIILLLAVGFGHALCLGFYLVWLVDFCLVWGFFSKED